VKSAICPAIVQAGRPSRVSVTWTAAICPEDVSTSPTKVDVSTISSSPAGIVQ